MPNLVVLYLALVFFIGTAIFAPIGYVRSCVGERDIMLLVPMCTGLYGFLVLYLSKALFGAEVTNKDNTTKLSYVLLVLLTGLLIILAGGLGMYSQGIVRVVAFLLDFFAV